MEKNIDKYTKIIIVDGIPGSGKSTLAENIAKMLSDLNYSNRFYYEMEKNHPLFIYERKFTSFTDQEEANYFYNRVIDIFTDFTNEHIHKEEISIVESVIFQDTLSYAFNMGMEGCKIISLFTQLKRILMKLNPILIYIYQMNVRGNWEFISEVRGEEWIPSLRTKEGLDEAERDWKPNQEFIKSLIGDWNIPKLIINNKEYLWEDYTNRSIRFVKEHLRIYD